MAQTAVMYARLHRLHLERVLVHVERDASRERDGTYVLNITIGFEGDLSADHRARMLQIIERCPVHKLMTTATVEIRTVEA
jgi:putative redox protein